MQLSQVRWRLAIGGFFAAEIPLIAAAFGWVAIYSYLINPGQPLAVYEQYAQVASPWVGLLLGFPVFYLVCRWIGRRPPASARPTALAVFGILFVIELAAVLSSGPNPVASLWFEAFNLTTKLLACLWGAASGAKPA